MKNVKTAKNVYVVMTIFCIIGGAILLVWPGLGLDVLCKVCGSFTSW